MAKATETKTVERAETSFIDYRKSNSKVIKVGAIKIVGMLTKETKQNVWAIFSVPAEKGKKGKMLGYFGARKDGKGVWASSEILEICTDTSAERVEETIMA